MLQTELAAERNRHHHSTEQSKRELGELKKQLNELNRELKKAKIEARRSGKLRIKRSPDEPMVSEDTLNIE